MVNRSSIYPRLPRMYWGELIYATPGCGKTYVANKYRDVVDGDDLIVEAISEVAPHFYQGNYDDPRKVIFRYFRDIQFNRKLMWKVYNVALRKMRAACSVNNVVLFGTMDLMHEADRMFIETNIDYVRNGFENKRNREQEEATDSGARVHYIDEYLDNSLQVVCRNYMNAVQSSKEDIIAAVTPTISNTSWHPNPPVTQVNASTTNTALLKVVKILKELTDDLKRKHWQNNNNIRSLPRC